MELQDFKPKINAPGIDGKEDLSVSQDRLTGLIEELKAADAKGKKTIAGFSAFILIMLIIYISIASSRDGAIAGGYRILAGVFCLILLYFFWLYQMLRKIDYTEPVVVFLKKARRRHLFMRPSDWFIVIPLLIIMGAGGGWIVHYSFQKYFDNTTAPLLIYIIFFLSVVIFGFWASKKNWKRDKGELLSKVSDMLRELD